MIAGAVALAAALATPPGALPPRAQPLSASSRAARAEVRLGERFRYAIEIRHRPGERYALPEPLALAPFDAQAAGCARAEGKDEVVTTCAMQLALFELGPADVPAISLRVETPAGEAALEVGGPRVTGVGVLDPDAAPDQLALRAPAPPVPLLLPTWRPLLLAAGGLAAAALALLLWRTVRRRLRAAPPPPPPLPAHVRFARRLEALAAERLPEQGRGRELYFRLSALVREHLGAVTGTNAVDLTTLEIQALLAQQPDPRLDAGALVAFLEAADVVKFGHGEAGGERCAMGMAFAGELLRRTTPDPSGPAPAPGFSTELRAPAASPPHPDPLPPLRGGRGRMGG